MRGLNSKVSPWQKVNVASRFSSKSQVIYCIV